jgi:hypothetical protein
MRLNDVIKFQKALELAATASNPYEAQAAELAVRRIVKGCNLDPTRIPDKSIVSKIDFTDNALLQKLRDEYREQHPHKPKVSKRKPKPKPKRPDPVSMCEGMFDDFFASVAPESSVNIKRDKSSERDKSSWGGTRAGAGRPAIIGKVSASTERKRRARRLAKERAARSRAH